MPASWRARGGGTPGGAEAAAGVSPEPVRPYSIESWQAAIEPERAGMAKGLTCPGPRSRSGSSPPLTSSLPPPPGLPPPGAPLPPAAAAGFPAARRAAPPLRAPVAEVEARVGHRLLARGHGEVDEAAHAARHLAVHGDRRVEVLDLGGDAHVVGAGVEGGDRAAAAHARHEVAPERGVVVSDRRHRAEAGDDGAARRVLAGHGRDAPLRGGAGGLWGGGGGGPPPGR